MTSGDDVQVEKAGKIEKKKKKLVKETNHCSVNYI